MAGQLYTHAVLEEASALLVDAQTKGGCDSGGKAAASAVCIRIQKSVVHLEYARALATAANNTASSAMFHHRKPASDFTQPVEAMVLASQTLQATAHKIAGKHIVNVYYTLAKANERGDLLGLLAANDAPTPPSSSARVSLPTSYTPTSTLTRLAPMTTEAPTPRFMLSTQYWYMALDPSNVGVKEKWFAPSFQHSACWNRSAVGCPGGCRSAAMDAWDAAHPDQTYNGASWWAVRDLCNQNGCAALLGDNSTTSLYMKDGSNATTIQIWYNGVDLGGCSTHSTCSSEIILKLPGGAGGRPAPGKSVLVVRMDGAAVAGKMRRLFVF